MMRSENDVCFFQEGESALRDQGVLGSRTQSSENRVFSSRLLSCHRFFGGLVTMSKDVEEDGDTAGVLLALASGLLCLRWSIFGSYKFTDRRVMQAKFRAFAHLDLCTV